MTVPITKTRLTLRANGEANSYTFIDEKGNWFMSVLMNGEQMTETQTANLAHMMNLWNASQELPVVAPGKCPGVGSGRCGWDATTKQGDTCRVCGDILPF